MVEGLSCEVVCCVGFDFDVYFVGIEVICVKDEVCVVMVEFGIDFFEYMFKMLYDVLDL